MGRFAHAGPLTAMSLTSSSLRRMRAARPLPQRRSRLERSCVTLGDGATTTLHVASYERSAFDVRVVALEEPAPLVRWCAEQGVRQAVVGGFFVRPDYAPLGQLRIAGEPRPSVAFEAPWGDMRACLHIADGMLRIARRDELDAEPAGDLLQAGPLLVADGRRGLAAGEGGGGVSAAAPQ